MSAISAAVGMVDDVGAQLAGRGFRLHARDELPAGRAQQLHLDEREALVERLDHELLHLGDVRRVEDQRALFLGRLDQLGRTELGLDGGRDGEQRRQRERTVGSISTLEAIPSSVGAVYWR